MLSAGRFRNVKCSTWPPESTSRVAKGNRCRVHPEPSFSPARRDQRRDDWEAAGEFQHPNTIGNQILACGGATPFSPQDHVMGCASFAWCRPRYGDLTDFMASPARNCSKPAGGCSSPWPTVAPGGQTLARADWIGWSRIAFSPPSRYPGPLH